MNADEIYNTLLRRVEKMLGNETTFSNDLGNVAKSLLGSKFKGIFPADQLPKLTKTQPYAIVNLDSSWEEGSHWIALAKSGKKVIFYDSFGRPAKSILPLLKPERGGGGTTIVNTEDDAEQGVEETNCGQRSISFLLLFDKYGEKMALQV
jgi:hypothetical protein